MENIMERVRRGDEKAFKELYEKYYRLIRKIARDICGNEWEDVMQEVFMKIYAGSSSYKNNGKLEQWISQIARNTSRDSIRKTVRRREYPLDEFDTPDERFTPEEKHYCEELDIHAKRILDGDPHIRVVLLVHSGYSYKKVGKNLGIPLGTVKSSVSRGREKLRKVVERDPELSHLL